VFESAIHVALLEHLGIKHVSLAAHSAGTVFALDLALHNPEILHPERPYIAIAGPWILPSHTGSVLMSMTNLIPGSMMKTEKLVRTIVSYIGPALGFTFKASQLVVSSVYTPPPRTPDKKVAEIDRKYAELERNLYLGKIGDDVFKGPEQRIFAESIRGLNDESVVLMHKGAVSGGWSDWGDFDVLVPRLGEKLRSAGRKLRVDVWYAESDALIGDDASKGPAWFDGLWQAAAQNGSIEYHRDAVKGSDHDSVWNLKHGRCRKVFEYMSGLKEEVVEAADE
jgi:pimeloyl-ACP methyl ester carboxylesterase